VRIVEITATAVVYCFLGLFTSRSNHLLMPIVPAVLPGSFTRDVRDSTCADETFRRVCMSFDAWIVGFGLARALLDLRLLGSLGAYGIWGAVILFDLYLLHRYFLTGGVNARIESLSLLKCSRPTRKAFDFALRPFARRVSLIRS
jgi:hypothetical protein